MGCALLYDSIYVYYEYFVEFMYETQQKQNKYYLKTTRNNDTMYDQRTHLPSLVPVRFVSCQS